MIMFFHTIFIKKSLSFVHIAKYNSPYSCWCITSVYNCTFVCRYTFKKKLELITKKLILFLIQYIYVIVQYYIIIDYNYIAIRLIVLYNTIRIIRIKKDTYYFLCIENCYHKWCWLFHSCTQTL